ncbi:MAG TPA: GNAT family N-acetyltransferase [archaeon]|nr:GNAT family N-acetyltransferase [archaeon]
MKLIKRGDPRKIESLELGADSYVDRLYGCFRFDNPRAGGFKSEQEVEIIYRSGRKLQIRVPGSMRIPLPEKKAVNLDSFRMEPIGDNLDTMMLLTMRAGWNQVERDLERMVGFDPQGNFVARFVTADYDIPVSTATVNPLGKRHTWIGMILVHPELRRQGVANAMMQHCVRYAIGQGRIINGLDATPMGNTVYGAVGYVDSYRIWRSWFPLAQFRGSGYDTNRVSTVAEQDLDGLVRYDTARYLERGNVIRGLFKDSAGEAYVYHDDSGDIRGYVLARPGRLRHFVGPFLADSEDIARELLSCVCSSLEKKGVREAFIDTPEARFADPGRYDRSKFDQEVKPSGHALIREITPVRDFTRMYQVVDERKAAELVENFIKVEELERSSYRVQEFERTMQASVANCTETAGFMEYEDRMLQKYYWGITGPEKG